MRIGQVAAQAAVNVQTLRYYERRGLMPAAPRGSSGYRDYDPGAVGRVRFIKHAQAIGFTLDDIARLLGDTACAHVRARAGQAISRIDSKIAELSRMRAILATLVSSCDASGECPILHALEEPA